MNDVQKKKLVKALTSKRFLAIVGAVVIAGGVVVGLKIKTSMKQGEINYMTQAYEVSRIVSNTGTFRYDLDIKKGSIDKDATSTASGDDAKKKIKDSESGDSSNVEATHEINNPWKNDGVFTDSWTGLDGVKKTNSKDAHYRVTYTGTVVSLDPLTAQGEVYLDCSTANSSKLKLLDYKVIEGVWYINLPETKKALQDSGTKELVAIGNAMPDYPSTIKFSDTDFIVDSIFGDSYETAISEVKASTERTEFLRLVTTATSNLQPLLKEIKPSVYAKDGDKYYFAIDSKNSDQVSKGLDKFNSKSGDMFDSYLTKCVSEKLISEDDKQAKEAGKDKVVDLVNTSITAIQDKMKLSDFQSVNWFRINGTGENAKAELSMQASWSEDNTGYLISLTGEYSRIVDKKIKVAPPKSAIEYSKTARDTQSMKLTTVIDGIKKALDKDNVAKTDVNASQTKK